MGRDFRIGIDFDNTIAGYDRVFAAVARESGWLNGAGPLSKRAVRKTVRALPDGETKWQMLQAQVYGARMADAVVLSGACEFLDRCVKIGIQVFVISHKTQFATFDPQRIDLRQAARDWMRTQGLDVPAYFEPTRSAKIARIAALGCTHFVDDLEEVFTDPSFPEGVARILLSTDPVDVDAGIRVLESWHDIAQAIFA